MNTYPFAVLISDITPDITPHTPDINSSQASYQLSVLGQQINDNINIGCLLLPFHGTAVSSSLESKVCNMMHAYYRIFSDSYREA